MTNIKFEAQIMPIKPEGSTIFGDAFNEPETHNITTDYNIYIEKIKSFLEKNVNTYDIQQYRANESINFVRYMIHTRGRDCIDYYMTGPTALLNGDQYEAKTFRSSSINDIIDFLHEQKPSIFYGLDFKSIRPKFFEADQRSFKKRPVDIFTYENKEWILRYGVFIKKYTENVENNV